MKTYKNHFRTFDTFKRAIRSISKEEWADWIKIGKHWYTCEEFDIEGKQMRFTSITERKHIDINTSNRYGDLWLQDAEIEQYDADNYRFHPNYYIDKKDFLRLKRLQKRELVEYVQKIYGSDETIELLKDYLL